MKWQVWMVVGGVTATLVAALALLPFLGPFGSALGEWSSLAATAIGGVVGLVGMSLGALYGQHRQYKSSR